MKAPMLAAVEPDWTAAVCRGTGGELHLADKGRNIPAAQRMCDNCPIKAGCAAWALARREAAGVWGGLSATARRRILRELAASTRDDAAATESPTSHGKVNMNEQLKKTHGGETCSSAGEGFSLGIWPVSGGES